MNFKVSISKFLVLLLFIGLSCCKKEDCIVKEVPVEYYLTDSQKTLFENFQSDTLTFISEDDKSIYFISKGITDYVSHSETDLRKGEALSVDYRSESDHLPNFFIDYHLRALEDGTCELLITFGTGTFWNERANDFKFSHFYLNPFRNADDSIYSSQEWFNFNFLDSLSLGETTYSKVYSLPNGAPYGSGKVVNNCYYQIEKGIIAFTEINERKWIIKD